MTRISQCYPFPIVAIKIVSKTTIRIEYKIWYPTCWDRQFPDDQLTCLILYIPPVTPFWTSEHTENIIQQRYFRWPKFWKEFASTTRATSLLPYSLLKNISLYRSSLFVDYTKLSHRFKMNYIQYQANFHGLIQDQRPTNDTTWFNREIDSFHNITHENNLILKGDKMILSHLSNLTLCI